MGATNTADCAHPLNPFNPWLKNFDAPLGLSCEEAVTFARELLGTK
jgi:hypothetical protein